MSGRYLSVNKSRHSIESGDNLNSVPQIARSRSSKRGSIFSAPKIIASQDVDSWNVDDDVTRRVTDTFISLSSSERLNMIITLIKLCDTSELSILTHKLPRLHKDFLAHFPSEINYRILTFVHPKDLCSIVCVSKTWARVATDTKAWEKIYSRLGLLNMANVCYLPDLPMVSNAKRLYALTNWSKGVFTLKHIKAHPLGILCIAFDGKLIATGSVDRTCRIFDVRTGKCLHSLSGHEQKLFSIALNKNRVYTGSSDKTIIVWDTEMDEKNIATLTGHDGTISCLKTKDDLLFSGSDDKTIRIWNVSNKTLRIGDGADVDSSEINVAMESRPSSQSSTRHPCLLRVLHGHSSGIRSLDINQNILVSGDIYGTIRVWHTDSGNCLTKINIFANGKHEMELMELLSISIDGPKTHSKIVSDPITTVQYVDSRLVISTFSGNIFIYKVKPFGGPNKSTINASYPALRNWIYSEGAITFSHKYKIDTLTEKKKNADTWALSAYSDSWRLMVGGSEGHCMLWNHLNQKLLYELKGNSINNGTGRIELHVQEYAGTDDFDPTYEPLKENGPKIDRAITGVAFDDLYIVAGGMDGVIRIWEAAVKLR